MSRGTFSDAELTCFTDNIIILWKFIVFDLIPLHTPISAQSSNFTSILFVYFFKKAYVVITYLNCVDLSEESEKKKKKKKNIA